jgi:energy-coupling factor transport system ATP-binding protein
MDNKVNDIVLTEVSVNRNPLMEAKPVLKHLHLRIAEGEWVHVVGPNGSGKSTFAQLIAGVMDIHSGKMDRGFLPAIVPYVMQQNVFFGETPWEDLLFQLEQRSENPIEIPKIARQALTSVGLEALMHRPLNELSGGQRQLAAVAGCIAAKAPLLLLDEATSMLDSNSRKLVLEAIKVLHQQGTSVIWLTHHMDELEAGNRVIGLNDGSIFFDGTTADFFYSTEMEPGLSPCELLGFTPPYPVQVAHGLIRQGVLLQHLPLSVAQLAKAVIRHAM